MRIDKLRKGIVAVCVLTLATSGLAGAATLAPVTSSSHLTGEVGHGMVTSKDTHAWTEHDHGTKRAYDVHKHADASSHTHCAASGTAAHVHCASPTGGVYVPYHSVAGQTKAGEDALLACAWNSDAAAIAFLDGHGLCSHYGASDLLRTLTHTPPTSLVEGEVANFAVSASAGCTSPCVSESATLFYDSASGWQSVQPSASTDTGYEFDTPPGAVSYPELRYYFEFERCLSGNGCVTLRLPSTEFKVGVVTPQITLRGNVNSLMEGGTYLIYTYTGEEWENVTTLATGEVPSDGGLNVSVTLPPLADVPSHLYMLTAAKVLDDTWAYFASRSAGAIPEDVWDGAVLDWGTADVLKTRWFSTKAEGLDAIQSGSAETTLIAQGDEPGRADPGFPDADVLPVCTNQPTSPCGAPQATREDPHCGDIAAPRIPTTCWLERQDFTTYAKRDHSVRIMGMTALFRIKDGHEQEWQNAIRLPHRRFEVDGTTKRTYRTNVADEWPQRGDCWVQDPPGDAGACDNGGGWWVMAGTDTWRRQIEVTFIPNPRVPTGVYFLHERLINKAFNRGEAVYPFFESAKYYSLYQSPGWAAQGAFGNRVVVSTYSTTRRIRYESKYTYGLGTDILIDGTFGPQEFQSTMRRAKVNTVEQDWTTRSQTKIGWLIYRWVAYDNSTDSDASWPNTYWTCEFQNGEDSEDEHECGRWGS